MFKKIFAFFLFLLSLLTLINFKYYNNASVFKDESNLSLYASKNSSRIVLLQNNDFLRTIKAETCTFSRQEFDLEQVLIKYDARLVGIEKIDEGINYYCFSEKIKNRQTVGNLKVNLHIFVGESIVKLGSPYIYDGY